MTENTSKTPRPIKNESRKLAFIKKATGMTFHKFVVDEKLQHASSLLISSDDSITSIAYSLSFNTSSHFSNLFFEKYNCTPSQYRKRHAK